MCRAKSLFLQLGYMFLSCSALILYKPGKQVSAATEGKSSSKRQKRIDLKCRPTRLCVTVCVCEPAMCSAVTEGKSPSKQQKRIDLKWKVHADLHDMCRPTRLCVTVCV